MLPIGPKRGWKSSGFLGTHSLRKSPDFNPLEKYWTVKKRLVFLFQLQFLDKDDIWEGFI